MNIRGNTSKFMTLLFMIPVILAGLSNDALAQEIGKRKPTYQIDFEQLVTTNKFNSQSIGDPVWSLIRSDNLTNNVIIQIPIKVKHGDKPAQVSSKTCKVRGGRFLTVYVPSQEELGHKRRSNNRFGFGIGGISPGGSSGVISRNFDLLSVDPETKKADYSDLPIPRVTKKVTITLEGVAQWDLARKFDNLKIINDNSFYAMKVDRALLAEKDPDSRESRSNGPRARERTERRSTKGLSRAEKRALRDQAARDRLRKKEEEKQLRQIKRDYITLKSQVAKVPTKFSQEKTETVWLVYSVPAELTEYEITVTKHKKWKISKEQLNLAMTVAKIKAQDIDPSITESSLEYENTSFEILDQIYQLSNGKHPNDLTLAIASISFNNALAWVDNNGYTPKIAKRALTEKNVQAVSLLAKGLASIKEQTRTSVKYTTEILGQYSHLLDHNALRHANMAVLSITSRATLLEISKLSLNVKGYLSEKNSPDVDILLQSLLDAWDKARGTDSTPRPRYLKQAFRMLRSALNFKDVVDEKKEEVISFIVKSAGNHIIPLEWINEELLASSDSAQIESTLSKIADLKITPSDDSDSRRVGTFRVIGESRGLASNEDNPIRRIFIYSDRHPIFNLLAHSNPKIKSLAWNALKNFSLIYNDELFKNNGGEFDKEIYEKISGKIYKRFVDLAMTDKSKQNNIFDLIGNQKGSPQAIETLMNLGSQISGSNGQKAAGAFWDIGEEFGEEFGKLARMQQIRLLENLYTSKKFAPPHTINYLKLSNDGPKILEWISKIKFDQPLPTYAHWVKAAGGEKKITENLLDSDLELAGDSAEALVQLAGGIDSDVVKLKAKLKGISSSEESLEIWDEFKQKLLVDSLKRYVGKYTMYIKGKPTSRKKSTIEEQALDDTFRSENGLSLGVYNLKLSSDLLRFEGVDAPLTLGEEQLVIRIENIRHIWTWKKNYDLLKPIGLSPKRQFIDLLPRIDGSWQGHVTFDNEVVEMILIPVK